MAPRMMRRIAVIAVTAALVTVGSVRSVSPVTVAVDNATVTYDVLGQRLDAHDGDLLQVADGTIYLYGTSYGCGFKLLTPGTAYCGVKVYKSVDLRTWSPAGAVGGSFAFDHLDQSWQDQCAPAPGVYGCYRPHVVQRPSDGRFIMWVNIHGELGYRVLVSDSPAGPFLDTWVTPTLAVQPPVGALRYGDMDLTIAPDDRGYVTYTAIDPVTNSHELVIERLDETLTTGTGEYQRLDLMPGKVDLVEAPGLFCGPNRAWYLTYSSPARPYMATGTGIVDGPRNTSDPLSGRWACPRMLNATSCVGQPTGVWPIVGPSGATTWVWGSDRWESGNPNQSRAENIYGPLTFSALGGTAIDAAGCHGSWTLP